MGLQDVKNVGNLATMPSATDFRNNPDSITSSYVVLVREHLGVLQPTPPAGTRQVILPANFQLHFTLGTVAQTRTLVVVDIYTAAQHGSLSLYFLPWMQNAAIEMTIPAGGGGPDIFMTSMLSGCTVMVHGTPANPTVIHANSRRDYEAVYNQRKTTLEHQGALDATQIHSQAESRGNLACTAAINGMLPAVPGGAQVGHVRKADYAGRVTAQNLDTAKQRYYAALSRGERFKQYKAATSGPFKPKTGAFVYGNRDVHNNWAFYYQAAVEVQIDVDQLYGWSFGWSTAEHQNESAVLGLPTRFFP
jgi:hypothetical protein